MSLDILVFYGGFQYRSSRNLVRTTGEYIRIYSYKVSNYITITAIWCKKNGKDTLSLAASRMYDEGFSFEFYRGKLCGKRIVKVLELITELRLRRVNDERDFANEMRKMMNVNLLIDKI